MTVKVTDKNSKYYGMEFEGYCFYYDVNHTGSSPDLFVMNTQDGEKQILSTSIDVGHYWNQRRDEEIQKLGANVGDLVKIARMGSCSVKAGFDRNAVHIITAIDCSGHVTFDNGAAICFRPDVERVV